MSYIFGTYKDSPRPWSFNGTSGFWSVPGGQNWYLAVDKGGQQWASPSPITVTNGVAYSPTGDKLYAVETTCDYTLVFIDALANRKTGIDSPPPDHLSPHN